MKFFISSGIFAWSMAWFMAYLNEPEKVMIFSWVVIAVLAFETLYISYQANKGQLSHFNNSTRFTSIMFSLMGIAITIMTLWTGYIGFLFFVKDFPDLNDSYVWSVRLGILFFVVFALEGGIMASKLSHTVGGPDGSKGYPITNWSRKYGDLRIAHFFGMHALQILPLLSFYAVTNLLFSLIIDLCYFLFVCLLLIRAMKGKPLFSQ